MSNKELKLKLSEFIEKLKLDELSQNTLKSYETDIKIFINYLNDNNKELNKQSMIDYKNELNNLNYTLKTRNHKIVTINKFLKYLGLSEFCVKKLKEQQQSSLDEIIEPQEHKRMLRWAKKMQMEDMYLIIKIFALSGARVDELKYFTVENLDSNYIKGAYNKGKERTLIMTNELRLELKKYCKDRKIKSGYIFRSPVKENSMPHRSTIWRRLKRIAKCAKIKPSKIHPHAWRHLFAKKCKENGIDLDELADIMGHSSISTTAIYTRTSNKEKKNKLERIKY